MLMLISPAKKLAMESPALTSQLTQPDMLEDAQTLIHLLRSLDRLAIADLMKLSMPLADLNVARYQAWQRPFTLDNAKQALWAFRGDVYQSMNADTFSETDIAFTQQHLRILSGLYGLLRPLDLMQAYRLEMGTQLANPHGKDLYHFWGERITAHINQALAKQADNVLINLASQEYFKAIQRKKLHATLITPSFRERKGDDFKVIGIHAKRARGLMCRFIIQNQLQHPDQLRDFDLQGYRWHESLSTDQEMVFTRSSPTP